MSNGVPIHTPEQPPIERSFRHLDYAGLPYDLNRAIKNSQRGVVKALIAMTLQTEEYRDAPMSLVRAQLLDLSIPRFDQINELEAGREVDDELKGEIDDIYPRTAEILERTIVERERMLRSTDPNAEGRYTELIGGVSELIAFGLYNREGSDSVHIATASTPTEDMGHRNKWGENESFDLRVVSTAQAGEVHGQVKTSTSYDVYDRRNMIINIANLAGSTEDALHTLPRAIIHEVEGGVPKEEFRVLNRASRMLFRQTKANLIITSSFDMYRRR